MDRPAVAETHISWVVLLGERAYKLLKPVELGFLDHRTREARERACHRETDVNRRFAPDVYLGVLDVLGDDGHPRDHLVEMRRMPAQRRLSALLGTPEAPGLVREVALVVAAVHAAAPTSPEIALAGTPERVRANWDQGLDQVDAVAAGLIGASDRARARELVHRYLAGREPLLRRRIEEGWVRDGHGDLLADDVFCLDDGPRLLDCLAFDDGLRHADVLADAAFLAMDLEAQGGPDLAPLLLDAWSGALGERHPASLADHYVAYRAHVRAKVASLRHEQGDEGAGRRARELHDLALAHLERARVRLVLVGGAPGTGKSTVAAALAERAGWAVVRSDAMREGAGGPPAGYGEGRYAPERRARVYAAMLEEAGRRLGLGESVVLDASWGDAARREDARAAARSASADLVEIRCQAPQAVAARRIAARLAAGVDPSEATPEIGRRLAADADPWPEALPLATDRDLADTIEAAAALAGLPGEPGRGQPVRSVS
jgi:aminoglycoside phosphotransferase family enzyme/predicted kinase